MDRDQHQNRPSLKRGKSSSSNSPTRGPRKKIDTKPFSPSNLESNHSRSGIRQDALFGMDREHAGQKLSSRSNSPSRQTKSTPASQGSFSRQHQVAQPETDKQEEPRGSILTKTPPYSPDQKHKKSNSTQLNWTKNISDEADSSTTKNEEPTSGEQEQKQKWSETISKYNPLITIDECTDADLEKKKNILNAIPTAIPIPPDKKLPDYKINSFKSGKGGNIAFAEYEIDGKTGKIDSFSGERNFEGFAKFLPDDQRKFKTVKADSHNGRSFERKADTEAKILEQIYAQTTSESTGTIRLFSQRPVCDSCGGVIEQFTEERPYIKIKVVEEKSK